MRTVQPPPVTLLPAVRLLGGHKALVIHGVYADGDLRDGSLHGFRTLCARYTLDGDGATNGNYRELPPYTALTCCRCLRVAWGAEWPSHERCLEHDRQGQRCVSRRSHEGEGHRHYFESIAAHLERNADEAAMTTVSREVAFYLESFPLEELTINYDPPTQARLRRAFDRLHREVRLHDLYIPATMSHASNQRPRTTAPRAVLPVTPGTDMHDPRLLVETITSERPDLGDA